MLQFPCHWDRHKAKNVRWFYFLHLNLWQVHGKKKIWKASWNSFGLSLPTWDTSHNYPIIMLQSFSILGRTDTVTLLLHSSGKTIHVMQKRKEHALKHYPNSVPKVGGITYHWTETSPEFPPSSEQMPLQSQCMGKLALVLDHAFSAVNQQTAVLLI